MQKYFIHKNNQSHGPFSIAELKTEKITYDTMIWFEGAEDWQKASEITELNELIKSIPPPLENLKSQSTVLKTNENNLLQKSKKASITLWLAISGFIIQSVFLVFLYFNQDENINALEIEIMEMQYDIKDIKEHKDYSQSGRINNYQDESLEKSKQKVLDILKGNSSTPTAVNPNPVKGNSSTAAEKNNVSEAKQNLLNTLRGNSITTTDKK